jgi:hypothetical protein
MTIGSFLPIRFLVVVSLLLAAAPAMQSAPRPSAARPADPSGAPGELMADFVANHGQWRGDVRFAARRGPVGLALERHTIRVGTGTPGRDSLAFVFEGASPEVTLAGERRGPTVYNFLSGRDSAAWQLNVPAYRSVRYRRMYDGIDVRVREQSRHFEYDLIVSPRADVEKVSVRVDGATAIDISADGALLISTAAGVLRQTPPATFETLPDGRPRPVKSAFRIIDRGRYGFAVPERDRSLPLVIDPGLIWSTLIGGTSHDQFSALEPARDGSGDLFVSGGSYSTDFGSSPTPVHAIRAKAFVARLDAAGTHYDFVTFINGLQNQTYPGAMAADAGGGVTLVGTTVDLDFPVTAGAYQTNFRSTVDGQSDGDAFVLRLAANGTPVFGTYLGGTDSDGATAIVRDPSGALIVIGTTRSPDFPTTAGAYDQTFNSAPAGDHTALGEDTFIARLTADGSQLTYGTFFGGQTYEATRDAVIDAQGYLTIVGVTTSSETGRDIPVTPDAFDATWNGWEDGFIARFKLDGAGAADLKYSSFLGGVNLDAIEGVSLDPTNAETVVVAGHTWFDHFTGPFFPTTAGVFKPKLTPITPPTSLFPHTKTGFVTKFRFPSGGPGSLVWSTFAGGNWEDVLTDVAVDEVGNVIAAGATRSYDLPTTRGAIDRTQEGVGNEPDDCFVWKLNGTGSQLLYSTYFGGTGSDCTPVNTVGAKLAYLGNSTIALAGTAVPYEFPTTAGVVVEHTDPATDPLNPFVAKMTLEADNSGDLTVDAPTLLSPPNNSTTGGSGGAVVFRWNEVSDPSGIEGYVYEISTRTDFAPQFTAYKGSVNANEVILGTIAIQTPWHWRVRAADRAGNLSAWSATSTFTAGVSGGTPIANFVQIYPTSVIGGSSAQGVLHMTDPAPAGGAVVTLTTRGPISIPQTVTVPAGAISANFTIATTPVPRSTPVSIYATVNGVGGKGTLTVDVPSGPKAAALALDPLVVTGGNPSSGTVTLSAPAPADGTVVPLVSSHPQYASVPASVMVPAGALSATFPIATSTVPFAFDVTIEAVSSVNASRKLALRTPGPRLTSFTLSASNVSGGAALSGTLRFSAPIPPAPFPATGDALVTIRSTQPAVGLSPLVIVPIGQTTATFNIGVRNVPATTTLEIVAAYDNVALRAPLTINGSSAALSSLSLNVTAVSGGQGGVGFVTLTAPAPPGHVLVTLSSDSPAITLPPDVLVSSGSTSGLFAFNALPVTQTTPATITASYGASRASANVTINPSHIAGVWVTGLALNPSTVSGGAASSATVTLNTAAPAGGASVQLSAMSPASVPATVTVPAGAASATFNVSTSAVSTTTPAKVWAVLNTTWGAALTVQSGGTPSGGTPAAPSLLAPAGGAGVTLPLTLDWNDVTNAASYQVQVDDSSSLTAPRTIDTTVTSSQFTTSALSNRQYWWRVRGRNSSGVAGAWSSIRSFTVQASPPPPPPPPPGPTLTSLVVSPSSVVGGSANAQGTATLTAAAPAGGATVALSSSNTGAATVPASVTIAAGATSGGFTVTSRAVTASTPVTVSGTFGGVTRSATLTVTPASGGGGSSFTLTVSATGRSGERVNSSPSGISVSVGSTGSAPFAAGTAITLSISNGRDAIWSGACSSGGNKTRTCTFTLNANASVSANVQ